jgi:hypothetical protein
MWPKQTTRLWSFIVVFGFFVSGCAQSRGAVTEVPVDSGNNVVRAQGQEKAAILVKAEVLPEINATIVNAQELGAKKIAPFSHARAVEKLKTLDAFISVNPESSDEIDARANEALFEANRLTVITQQAKQLKKMKPEEIALLMEKQLQTISAATQRTGYAKRQRSGTSGYDRWNGPHTETGAFNALR